MILFSGINLTSYILAFTAEYINHKRQISFLPSACRPIHRPTGWSARRAAPITEMLRTTFARALSYQSSKQSNHQTISFRQYQTIKQSNLQTI